MSGGSKGGATLGEAVDANDAASKVGSKASSCWSCAWAQSVKDHYGAMSGRDKVTSSLAVVAVGVILASTSVGLVSMSIRSGLALSALNVAAEMAHEVIGDVDSWVSAFGKNI